MIQLTRFNRTPLTVNAEMIVYIESTPDTVITTANQQKLIVLESREEVMRRAMEYRRAISSGTDPSAFNPAFSSRPLARATGNGH